MTVLRPAEFVTLVADEFVRLAVPAGSPRLPDVRHLDWLFEDVSRDVLWLRDRVSTEAESSPAALSSATEHALATTSMLFAAGAGHHIWRHWAGISAMGLLLRDQVPPPQRVGGWDSHSPDVGEALMYALVGAEWAMVECFPAEVAWPDDDGPTCIVASLALGQPGPGPIDENEESQVPWASFRRGVDAGDVRATSRSLHEVATARLDDYGQDWQRCVAASHPLFDLTACAAAALARHLRLVDVQELTEVDRRYLEPGLALPEPEPLFPTLWPEPSRLVLKPEKG